MQTMTSGHHRYRTPLTWLCFILLSAGVVLLYIYWNPLLWQTLRLQNVLHRDMAMLLRKIAEFHSSTSALWFLALCFGYGVFHAVGPGHGKTILTTYLATHNSQLRKAMWISFGASLIQALVATLLILVFAVIFKWTRFETNHMGQQLDQASFWLVIALGIYICSRSIWQLYQQYRHQPRPVFTKATPLKQPITLSKIQIRPYSCIIAPHPAQPVATTCSCGHTHAPKQEQLEHTSGWAMITLMISMGLRPCTGSLLVLVLAKALNMLELGIASVFVMALGTGLTICLMAWISHTMRHLALRLLGTPGSRTGILHYGLTLVSLVGGIILISFGYGMMMLTQTQISPFFRPY